MFCGSLVETLAEEEEEEGFLGKGGGREKGGPEAGAGAGGGGGARLTPSTHKMKTPSFLISRTGSRVSSGI